MLDTNIANMGSPLSAGSTPQTRKGSGKGAAKKAARPKTPDEKKDLEKDIKAFLGCDMFIQVSKQLYSRSHDIPSFSLSHPRLRDKGGKAREVAADMNELKIPHQEAVGRIDVGFPWISSVTKCNVNMHLNLNATLCRHCNRA